jgi:hypothetical protein
MAVNLRKAVYKRNGPFKNVFRLKMALTLYPPYNTTSLLIAPLTVAIITFV